MNRRGFTLFELILALAISLIVLIGIIALSTTAVRYQVQDSLKGGVSGNTLYGLKRMQTDIEDASVILQPVTTSLAVSGCTNWSMTTAARLDASKTVNSFCYWSNNGALQRHTASGVSCLSLGNAASCTSGAVEVVVANPPGVFSGDGLAYMFLRSGDQAIEAHYIVGTSTPTSARPLPVATKVDIRINTNKAYTNTTD